MLKRPTLFIMFLLTACQAVAGENHQAEYATYDVAFATEAASLMGTAIIRRTDVAVTVDIAETEIARINSLNQQLYATLVAGSTPTIAVIAGRADANATIPSTDTAMDDTITPTFMLTGISDAVQPADGCVVNARTTFPTTLAQLYITMRSYNVQVGTLLRAEWFYEGNLLVRQSWTVDLTTTERCLWFMIDTSDTTFLPGVWSVVVYVGESDIPIGSETVFYIVSEGG